MWLEKTFTHPRDVAAVVPGPIRRPAQVVDCGRNSVHKGLVSLLRRTTWLALGDYVQNDIPVVPRDVRLPGEERDTSERVIDYRIAPVRGYIASLRRSNFYSTAMAAAAGYSATILVAPAMGEC